MGKNNGMPKLKWLFFGSRMGKLTEDAVESGDFNSYKNVIMHEWLQTLTTLAGVLVPLFFILDIFMMPEKLLIRFVVYRAVSTLLILLQAAAIRFAKPGRLSYFHGYFISSQIGFMICLMTNDLGGFDSSYYSGLNLVIIGVNLLMPWEARHTGLNSLLIIIMYITFNLLVPHPFETTMLINNLFFIAATSVLAMSINHVRYSLIKKEFGLFTELKRAKDSLWSEIELAKKIQTALLPLNKKLTGYSLAEIMIPAKEVGGDYYDIIETALGERWVAIGDVTGHGVDSGLIMMMAQTSIMTLIKGDHSVKIADVLKGTNIALREDISRLGSNHYMTIMLLKLEDDRITAAGHHQDLLLYHALENQVEVIETKGTWLGITDDINNHIEVRSLKINRGDVVLLFTDGATEGVNDRGEMFGQERLIESFRRHASLPVQKILDLLLADIQGFQVNQEDDVTLIVIKKD